MMLYEHLGAAVLVTDGAHQRTGLLVAHVETMPRPVTLTFVAHVPLLEVMGEGREESQ